MQQQFMDSHAQQCGMLVFNDGAYYFIEFFLTFFIFKKLIIAGWRRNNVDDPSIDLNFNLNLWLEARSFGGPIEINSKNSITLWSRIYEWPVVFQLLWTSSKSVLFMQTMELQMTLTKKVHNETTGLCDEIVELRVKMIELRRKHMQMQCGWSMFHVVLTSLLLFLFF